MKPYDADQICRLANSQFPDSGDLALFNLMVEVMNGYLPYEMVDGPSEVIEDLGTEILVVLGMAALGDSPYQISWIFDQDHAHRKHILMDMVRSIKVDEHIAGLIQIERPPYTLAVLAACAAPDGRCAYAIFRHPKIDEAQARKLLAVTFSYDEAAEDVSKHKN